MKTRALLLALPLLALGCAENRTSIEIAEICSAPEPTEGACVLPSECDTIPVGHLFIDLDRAGELILYMQVDNQVPSNENLDDYRLNSNDAWLREYEIEYDGLPIARRTGRLPGSSYRVPAGGSTVIHVPALDEVATRTLAMDPSFIPTTTIGHASAVAHLKLKGVYANGGEFTTGEFDIAFEVCDGCFAPALCPGTEIPLYCPHDGQWPASAFCFDPEGAGT